MNIKHIRDRRNLNQAELAEMAGISQSAVSRAEAGDDGVTLGKLKAIAVALDVPLHDLFFRRTDAESELLRVFQSLPPGRQQAWLDISRRILEDLQR